MGRLDEIRAEAAKLGIEIPTPAPTPTPEVQDESLKEAPSVMSQIASPIRNAINDPVGTIGAAVVGAEKSFLDFAPGLTENLSGMAVFPVIRGAELAARAFVEDDQEPELTSLKEIVAENFALTNALEKRAPGVMGGVQLGMGVTSTATLAKDLAIKGGGQAIKLFKNARASLAQRKTINMADKMLNLKRGPILDAIVHRPDDVLDLIKKDSALVDDIAAEVGSKMYEIESVLGKNVGVHRDAFSVDPTQKIKLAPFQDILKTLEAESTNSFGESLLTGNQKSRVGLLFKLFNPKTTEAPKKVIIYEDFSRSSLPGLIKNKPLPVTTKHIEISGSDAMKALDKIDEITSLKEIENGNISASFVTKLLQLRKELKSQIRGNNQKWALADDLFSKYKEASSPFVARMKEGSLTRESFVDNLYGKNKTQSRKQLRKVLDFSEYIDGQKGHGDTFFRRLANIKGVHKIQEVEEQVNRVKQENVNTIVRFWTKVGEGTGAASAAVPATALGSLLGIGSSGQIGGAAAGLAAGRAVGGIAGFKIGQKMADPMRVLNQAMKAKELSKDARRFATDLMYIHKNFGNEGVVAMMDIVSYVPAVREFVNYASGQLKTKTSVEKSADNKVK